jgi:hypothetical protein
MSKSSLGASSTTVNSQTDLSLKDRSYFQGRLREARYTAKFTIA